MKVIVQRPAQSVPARLRWSEYTAHELGQECSLRRAIAVANFVRELNKMGLGTHACCLHPRFREHRVEFLLPLRTSPWVLTSFGNKLLELFT